MVLTGDPQEIVLALNSHNVLSLIQFYDSGAKHLEYGVSGDMDIEFHYFMTHLVALRAGFKPGDAITIAYASQYTDDNQTPYKIEGGDIPYENLISQTEDITKPQEERLSIYPIFHFCPATIEEIFKQAPLRRDGTYHRLDTLPDNSNARKVFIDAMNSRNLYRLGIGAHMFADTFCHRDFVGWKDPFNWTRLDGFFEGIWSAVGPAIGHALAMHSPDIPALVWEDARLTSKYREKKNKEQILAAAGNIFDFLCLNTKPGNAEAVKKRLIGDLGAAMGQEVESVSDAESRKNTRIENYKALLGGDYKEYDKLEWFDAAVDRQVDAHTIGTSDVRYNPFWKGDYRKGDWYAFQEAVKAHQAVAFTVLGDTFEKMEIKL